MVCSDLSLCGLFLSILVPEGGEEVCAAGAAAKGGGGATAAEDGSGVAVHSGPARRWGCTAGPEAGGRRLTAADRHRPYSFRWVLQVSGARPWPKYQVGVTHWSGLDESQDATDFFFFALFNHCIYLPYFVTFAGWLNNMKKHLCTSGIYWKERTRLWLEQHVSGTKHGAYKWL